jgi:choline dehydrogenase-like flavoprotein
VGLLKLVKARVIDRRLYVTPNTPIYVQLNIEQAPHRLNRVRLSDELDGYGRPRAVVDWRVRDEDFQRIDQVRREFLAKWSVHSIRVSEEIGRVADEVLSVPHDVYHPVGTCHLGVGPESVVDPDLGVRGVGNLSVLSTAIFPTAGTANPTFGMLCFGDRLAEQLAREHQDGWRRLCPPRVASEDLTEPAINVTAGSN